MWNYLVVDQKPQSGDVIIIISGGSGRVEHGVRLYKSGYAGKILFSGGNETEKMRRQAISLGVPAESTIIENHSYTTFTNARNSLEIMQAQGFNSAILVTSPFHTRRAGIIFKQFFLGRELTVCSVPYDPSVAGNWWKNGRTSSYVVSEYFKLIVYYLFQVWNRGSLF